ncbi:MAG: hypothetical protein RL266_192 [Bacteroidota bacterium]|jgi:CRISPR/Cas system-associated exonuclease Cas4 (RecB family)
MKTFLHELADKLLAGAANDFSRTCIVLPNRRAGVFLRKAIAQRTNTAIWAPTVLSIEDFVFSLSKLVKADQTSLLFAFYQVYRNSVTDPQSIELFANWAPTFLSDINELDLNLIDAEDIFAQLYSIERIRKWNPSTGVETEFQKKHLEFVKGLYPYYIQLRQALENRKLAYQGMVFRQVAENIETIIASSDWESVWFAGFNALTISEERMMAAWQASGKATLLWDMDSFYADDPIHEAGHYIRRFTSGTSELKLTPDYQWKANRFATEPKQIELIAAQRNMAQAQIAGFILQNRMDSGLSDMTNVAVVLNDEQLLLPLLSSLPPSLTGINITMGYGLRYSQSATFVEHIFNLYSRFAENGQRFHHQYVTALLSDPFFKKTTQQGKQPQLPSQTFYSAEQLQVSPLYAKVFGNDWNSVPQFLINLKQLLAAVAAQLSEDKDGIEREFLFLLDNLAQRLLDTIAEYAALDSIRTLHTFWRQLLRNQQLDFVGEPLTGLQIMGMLETRNLDFDEVIMLGVNEGNLPSNSHANSYFTFDIRRAYGLACQNERDAVTAYHFYRLLQRARKVHLVYDQDTDSMGRGELSRYVKQLMLESGTNISISHRQLEFSLPKAGLAPEITITKGITEYERLLARAANGISPSAINTHRQCSLKYYFRYVAGIKEPDEYQEDMDSAKLGTAIHNTLEELYKPIIGRAITKHDLHAMESQLRPILNKHFLHELKTTEALTGVNLLTFEVGVTYIDRVLANDRNALDNGQVISIIGLERELLKQVSLQLAGEHIKVNLEGKADRLDRLGDGTVRVIDYKTGSFDKKFDIKGLEDFENGKTDNTFQMLMYLFLVAEEEDVSQSKAVGFYLRSQKVEHEITVSDINGTISGNDLVAYTGSLIEEELLRIFDRDQPFSQTIDTKRCEYCEFNGVCQR